LCTQGQRDDVSQCPEAKLLLLKDIVILFYQAVLCSMYCSMLSH